MNRSKQDVGANPTALGLTKHCSVLRHNFQPGTVIKETAAGNLPWWDTGEKKNSPTRFLFGWFVTIVSTGSEGRNGACSPEEVKTQHCSCGAQT